MKRTSGLLGLLLALCLLLSLLSLPVLAESVRYTKADLMEAENSGTFAKTGGWTPEQIGSWVGTHLGDWGMYNFYPNGYFVMTVFTRPSVNVIGTPKTLGPADEITFETTAEGDIWHLNVAGGIGKFRKISMPWVRLKAETETAAAGVDPAILGTYGGMMDGKYVEWTFHGEGRFTRVTPYQELTEHGTFLTGDGNLAILLGGKLITCPYKARASSLSLTYPDAFKVLQKRTGPLVQVPDQWYLDIQDETD